MPRLSQGSSAEDSDFRERVLPADAEMRGVAKDAENGMEENRRASTSSKAQRESQRKAREKRKQDADEVKSVMVDADAMKRKVRENLAKPNKKVVLYKDSGFAAIVVKSPLFEHLTLAVIAFNALWISIDTDHNKADLLIDADPIFIVVENFFCTFFLAELIFRWVAFKYKSCAFRDPWFMFDSAMVTMMILETWVMTVAVAALGGGARGGIGGNLAIVRVAKLMRLSRMVRMARLLRAMPELMIMIKGMMAATRSVFFTLCLLGIFLYIFAITFTQLCSGTAIGSKHYSSVPVSMYTLLMYGTLLDETGKMASEMRGEQMAPWLISLFFVFILLAALTVMNMLVGVLCEVVSAVAATEKEEMLVNYVNAKLHKVVSLLDQDGDNTISKKEFVGLLENVDAARALHEVGVDVVGLVDFGEFIFEDDSVSTHGVEKELSFAEFMEVVLQLRGSNSATVKDIVDLRKYIRNSLIETNASLRRIVEIVSPADNESLDVSINPAAFSAAVAPPALEAPVSRSPTPPRTGSEAELEKLRTSSLKRALTPLPVVSEAPEEDSVPPRGPLESDSTVVNFVEWASGQATSTCTTPRKREADLSSWGNPNANIVAHLRGKWYPVEAKQAMLVPLRHAAEQSSVPGLQWPDRDTVPMKQREEKDRQFDCKRRRSVPWGARKDEGGEAGIALMKSRSQSRETLAGDDSLAAEECPLAVEPGSSGQGWVIIDMAELRRHLSDQLVGYGRLLTARELEKVRDVLCKDGASSSALEKANSVELAGSNIHMVKPPMSIL